ncbi:hypothetical protein, partial [Maribellus maritimus]|uniref:hypothetical protein n=1 Tax=Maribellus maritimus TaxID=2870838 RepID=UPI001EEAC6F5
VSISHGGQGWQWLFLSLTSIFYVKRLLLISHRSLSHLSLLSAQSLMFSLLIALFSPLSAHFLSAHLLPATGRCPIPQILFSLDEKSIQKNQAKVILQRFWP